MKDLWMVENESLEDHEGHGIKIPRVLNVNLKEEILVTINYRLR